MKSENEPLECWIPSRLVLDPFCVNVEFTRIGM